MNRSRGFTLIETLVSISVIMMLIAAATASFMQLRTMTERIQARQDIFNASRQVFDRFRTECDAMVHSGAWWMRQTGSGSIELIFLRGKIHTNDFTTLPIPKKSLSDLLWTRLAWNPSTQQILMSSSTPVRGYTISTPWSNPDGYDFNGTYVTMIPQPLRQAGTSPQITLNANRLGVNDPNDLGDYDDLLQNALPIAIGCTDFSIQAVLTDGSAIDATTSLSGNGLPIDGLDTIIGANNINEWKQRPCLIRLRFTLEAPTFRIDPSTGEKDPTTVIQQVFSYSFRTVQTLPL